MVFFFFSITVTQKTQVVAMKLTHEEWNLAQVFQRKWTVSKVLHAQCTLHRSGIREESRYRKITHLIRRGDDKRGNNCRVLSHAENAVPFSYNNKKKSTKRRVICLVSLLDSRQIQIGRRSETHTQAVIITTGWAMDHHHLEKKREKRNPLGQMCAKNKQTRDEGGEFSEWEKKKKRRARTSSFSHSLYSVQYHHAPQRKLMIYSKRQPVFLL